MNIILTGASSGTGKVLYENFKRQGHKVVGIGIGGPDVNANFMYMFEEDVRQLLQACERFLSPDEDVVLICNAAITKIDFLEDHNTDDFENVLLVNLISPFLLTKEWVKRFGNRATRCIYTSSMATSIALRASPGYCASKAGLEAMSKVFAKEYAKAGKTFMCIAPGGIQDTVMAEDVVKGLMRTRGMNRQEAEAYSVQSPMGRNCTKEEVWKVFDFAVNHAPAYLSGETIRMTGAMGV